MKAVIALALAATGVQATFSWKNPGEFKCPKPKEETKKLCPPGTLPEFDFNGDAPGLGSPPEGFDYKGLNWKGFQFIQDPIKRDRLGRRTGGHHAVGTCGPKKEENPSFGCGKGGCNDGFDVDDIEVEPERDAELEFHYDMPDGKTCKTRQKCIGGKKNPVKNTQCAGAKKCTIVYPPPPKPKPDAPKPKPEEEKCKVKVHKIRFICKPTGSPSTTPNKPTTTPAKPTTPPAATTTTNPAPTTKDTTTPAVPTSSSSAPCATCKASSSTTSPSAAGTTSSPPAPPAGTTTPTTTPGAPPTSSLTTSAAGPSSFGNNTTPGVPPTTPGAPPTTSAAPPTTSGVPSGNPTTSGVATTTSGVPEGPKEQLPCPDILPKCINTFLFSVEGAKCADTTDHGCFCPSKIFVQNVYSCLYAHETKLEVISEAIIYFEGLCAPYSPKNPEICGPSITSLLPTPAPTTLPGLTYTTVVVTRTETVPCAGPDSSVSSSTNIVTVTATAPQVGLTAVPSQTEVALVPVAQVTTAAPIGTPAPSVPAKPSGSQGLPPAPSSTKPVVAGSGRFTASAGLAGFVAIFAAAML